MKARMPWYLILAMLICGVAAVVASFYFLAAIAAWAGWPGWSRWLFPLTVDALGGASLVVWMKPGFPDDARRVARRFALVAIAGSAAFNALSHLVAGEQGRPGWQIGLVVLIGAIPPIALAGIVEVAVLVMGPALKRARGKAVQPSTVRTAPVAASSTPKPEAQLAEVAPDPQPVVLHSVPTGANLDLDPDADDREWVEALNQVHIERVGRPIGRKTLQTWLKAERKRGMNSDVAAQLLREVKEAATG